MTEPVTAPSPSKTNHLLWLGPLLAVFGCLSYFLLFARWPLFRDTPWLNLLILVGAVALSFAGLRRAWPQGGWRRIGAIAGLGVSALFGVALLLYCYRLSYDLPSADLAVASGERIPAITLPAQDGRPVDLAEAAAGPLVLVFYRGFW
jgi:hypothetical protein